MYEKMYYDVTKDKTLLFNTTTGKLDWEKGKVDLLQLRLKTLQNLIDLHGVSFLKPIPSDIKIISVQPYKVSKKEVEGQQYLALSSSNNLLKKNDLRARDLDELVRNGGVLVTSINESPNQVYFLMPHIRKYEKNSSSAGRYLNRESDNYFNNNKSTNSNEEYIEATIRLPRNIAGNNQDIIEQILKSQTLMREYFLDMSQKLNYINNSVQTVVDDTKYEKFYKEQKNESLNLHAQVEKLIQDRKILEGEKKKAELIALNQIKQDLKMSVLAVEKQIDLEDKISSEKRIISVIIQVLKSLDSEEETINNILENEEIADMIGELSDNFDSKIQSLIDIKEDFIKNNIIKNKGV
ncbi:hypothetical protein [Terribacillus saccharophilus]|uniref:hypothetical protein n=1 Tax=Terribacillus saccharophilus TaxID=361277 RepID=UPI002989D699|nr:hypothetical protein [Terribacillus saccharophilus]MCM3226323.1 hypothetical protein [Terribacillus saccharophilus]